MDGTLSQDEINALLEGMDTSGNVEETDSSGQESSSGNIDESLLSDVEKDAIGEVANISMGSSATTLFSLVNQKVNITTPRVELCDWEKLMSGYERPCVFVQIKYTIGLDGSNIMILKEHDVMVITDLMMGGDGTNVEGGEIGELQLSAISEAMNQMMGASATALSSMINEKVDISPPQATLLSDMATDPGEIADFLNGTFVRISFRMQIGDLVDSSIMQLYPIDFAKNLYDTFITSTKEEQLPPVQEAPPQSPPQNMEQGMQQPMQQSQMQMQQPMPQMQMQPQMMQPQMQMQNMNVQPAQFQTFGTDMGVAPGGENISLIKDVPLEVTVELGRTHKPISDILDFAPGTIIELDKVAGEPVDVLVNGKFVARGEVVVIEESFGVRVTEIVK